MKIYIVNIISFLLCSSISFGQNPVNKMYEGEQDGDHSDPHINGNVRCKYTIKNGNLDGDRTCYYNNGDLWVVEQFTDGKFNGTNFLLNKLQDTVYIELYSNDTLLYTKNFEYYRNNSFKEIRTIWYKNDSTLIENPFRTKRSFGGVTIVLNETENAINNNGVIKTFYKSGEIKGIGEVINGVYNGKYIEYYESGELKIDASRSNDKFNGEYILYDIDGKTLEKCTFIDGKRQ